jgi:hypothetical protein
MDEKLAYPLRKQPSLLEPNAEDIQKTDGRLSVR